VIALSRHFDPAERHEIRMRAIFEAGKLDPRTFDEDTLAPCALRLAPSAWSTLADLAERSWCELRAAEDALLGERRRWRALGIPARSRAILAATPPPSERDVRFSRFDFHWTRDGWRASEINADVPGGFIEAGAVTRIVAEVLPGFECLPDPTRELARAVAARLADRSDAGVALVHATSYTDDQQVMRRIGAELAVLGVRSYLASPVHLEADGAGARARLVRRDRAATPIDAVVRFFPGEWLANLSRADRARWAALPRGLVRSNPLSALLIQGKRLPVVLRELGIATPTWDSVLPPTRAVGLRALAPRLVRDDEVLKPIWGRVGDGVAIEGVTPLKEWRRSRILARIFPKAWVLQRRFESQPLVDATGEPFHACVGVYVIDGRAAGAYARIARRPLIDGRARDAAVLVDRALDPSGATPPELAIPTSLSRDRARGSQVPRTGPTLATLATSKQSTIPNEVHHASH